MSETMPVDMKAESHQSYSALGGQTGDMVGFLENILESSTEYSIIGKDLDGKILLWNEGARRLYGYEPEEMVGKANSLILHTPEDVKAGKPQQMLDAALQNGHWEGTINRRRKNGQQFAARVVVTPRRDAAGKPIGFLLMSKDVTNELAFTEELRRAKLFDSGIVGNAQEAVDFITNILESSTEYSVIGKDLDGKILLWNEGARRLYGYEPEEVVGKANSSILHVPEDMKAGRHYEIVQAALRDGKWEGTLMRVRKNGERFTARVVITPRRDSKGKAIGFLLISKDISDEIRLTEELRATQYYARSLIEASLDPLVTISPEGKITDVNDASVQVTGVPREQLVGTDFSDYFTEPDKAREGYQQVFSEGLVRDYPLAIRHVTGRITDVLYNASVYKDDKGNVLGVFAAARDVTERKQAEARQRAAAAYARSLIEASLDPLVTISPEGKITDVNDASVQATGMPREQLVGTDFSDYFTEPDKAREGYQQVFSQGFVKDYPLAIRHTTGRVTDVLYNASVYKDDKGSVLGVFAAARDVTERKQAEARQRAAAAYARSLIEASLDPLVTISSDGKITDVNRATELATGIPRQRLTGTDFSDYFTEPDKAREGYQQVFSQGFVKDYPLAIRHTTGRVTDVLYNASVYKDDKGSVLGVFAAARDVTERKQAEARQRAAAAYARSLIEASLDPLVTISSDGKITDVNRATELATGIPRQRLTGTDFSDYFTEPDKAREGYQQVFSQGFVKDYPLAIRHTTGRITDVLYNASVYSDDRGSVLGVFAAARDVTERKMTEELQRASSAYARSLIEASLDPLVTISAQGKITDVNEASVQATGVPREQLIGTDFSDYFTEPDKAREGYQQVFSEGLVRDYPLAIRHVTGRITDVLYNASVYKDDKGNALGVFAAARDVTVQKRFEQSLQEANRMKSEFLANMSHELRTPLNSILILGQQLSENQHGNLTEKQVTFAKNIHSAGSDLLNLINDILDLSKIESGIVAVVVDKIPFASLRDTIDRNFRHMAEAKNLSFHMKFAESLPSTMNSDPQRLQQILKNLLSNAIKFTDRGHVNVCVDLSTQGWSLDHPVLSKTQQVVAFAVEDTGIGIAPEKQRLIFESFQQADAGTSRKYGGTGLGLAISRELATLLGGEICLTSTVGQGSTFILYLPLFYAGSATGRIGAASDSPAVNIRPMALPILPVAREESVPDDREDILPTDAVLLIAEDDPHYARVLQGLARDKGFKTLVAMRGQTALTLARQYLPTAITLDIFLPDMLGWTVLNNLKLDAATRHIPVQIITQEEARQHGLVNGAFAYIVKPVTTEDLTECFDRIKAFVTPHLKRLLVVEGNEIEAAGIVDLLGHADIEITTVPAGAEALAALLDRPFDCVVLDLRLPDMTGFELLDRLQAEARLRDLPVVVFTSKDLTSEEEARLRSVAKSIVLKDVQSPERLFDETALFLHRVVADLPEAKRELLERLHTSNEVLRQRKVLVVDDDVRNIFALASLLENQEMDVLTATNGRQAIEIIHQTPDLSMVLMDIMMPEMDGYETMREIRSEPQFRILPILALTAKAMKGDREKCLEAGASDYIAKPVNTDQLLSLMRVWLFR